MTSSASLRPCVAAGYFMPLRHVASCLAGFRRKRKRVCRASAASNPWYQPPPPPPPPLHGEQQLSPDANTETTSIRTVIRALTGLRWRLFVHKASVSSATRASCCKSCLSPACVCARATLIWTKSLEDYWNVFGTLVFHSFFFSLFGKTQICRFQMIQSGTFDQFQTKGKTS